MDRLQRARSTIWFVPALMVLASMLLAWATLLADARIDETPAYLVFGGRAEGARSVLSVIAGSMISFTGIVFSVTIVSLQLASSQFSPRILRSFLRSMITQVALGTFVATFVYSLLVLMSVRGGDDSSVAEVPAVSIATAFALALLSVSVFVVFIQHVVSSIRVASLLSAIGHEARASLKQLQEFAERHVGRDRVPPDAFDQEPDQVLECRRHGVMSTLETSVLVRLAAREDAIVQVLPSRGQYVPRNGVLARVHGGCLPARRARGAFTLADERWLEDDVGFGLRQLVDIAARALSPGVNDPTTAVQAIDQLHELLRRIGTGPLPSGVLADDDDNVRVVYPVMEWSEYLEIALREVVLFGAGQPQVVERVRALLHDLADVVGDDRIGPVRHELARLDERVGRNEA